MINLSTKKAIQNFQQEPMPSLEPNTYLAISKIGRKHPKRNALSFFMDGGKYDEVHQWSYEEFLKSIHQTANMFSGLGVGKNDVVSYILPNIPAAVFSLLGGQAAGIVNPVNPFLEVDQMADIMNACGTKVLVTLADFPNTNTWEKSEQLLDKIPTLETVLTVNPGYYMKGAFAEKQFTPAYSGRIKILDFHKTRANYPEDQLNFSRVYHPEDIATYFHTGGTTGSPKIAPHTHANELSNTYIMDLLLQLKDNSCFFCGLPWFHANGVIVTGICVFTNGHSLVLGTPRGYKGNGVLANFWKIVEHFEVNYFSAVPTILQYILNVPKEATDISSLKNVICGAAPLSVKLFEDFEAFTGLKILEGYGFTEGTAMSTLNPVEGERKIGSIGLNIPYHNLKVVILDDEGHYVRDADVNEIGVFVANGPSIFPGYKEAIHNKNAWVHASDKKWYNTGDLGREDADGFFWITGRKKELIIRGGHNIDPKCIEEVLATHPAVAAAAAIGRPDASVGELPVAYVELKPNNQIEEGELLAYAQQFMKERAAIPKQVYILDSLPLTAVGKIFKPDLYKRQITEVFDSVLAALPEIEKAVVRVENDKSKGMLAKIKLTTSKELSNKELQYLVDTALGGFTVKYELIF